MINLDTLELVGSLTISNNLKGTLEEGITLKGTLSINNIPYNEEPNEYGTTINIG